MAGKEFSGDPREAIIGVSGVKWLRFTTLSLTPDVIQVTTRELHLSTSYADLSTFFQKDNLSYMVSRNRPLKFS